MGGRSANKAGRNTPAFTGGATPAADPAFAFAAAEMRSERRASGAGGGGRGGPNNTPTGRAGPCGGGGGNAKQGAGNVKQLSKTLQDDPTVQSIGVRCVNGEWELVGGNKKERKLAKKLQKHLPIIFGM